MWCRLCLITAYFAILLQSCRAADNETFVAAVVEYHATSDSRLTEEQNFMSNVNSFLGIMLTASDQNVSVIVFPENGLHGLDKNFSIAVPDPTSKVVPADSPDKYHESLVSLSRAAKLTKMYTLVNLHESDKDANVTYNTNVVFDDKGAIIARYRKYNLFNEPFKQPKDPNYTFFTTPYGVFGTFTCFDILYNIPANKLIKDNKVNHILYPTSWFSELPFMVATQVQAAFAYTNDINLLAAGNHYPSQGRSGSGIYQGKKGAVTYTLHQDSSPFKLLVASLPVAKPATLQSGADNRVFPSSPITSTGTSIPDMEDDYKNNLNLTLQQQDLSAFETKLISLDFSKNVNSTSNRTANGIFFLEKNYKVSQKVCMKDFCCQFDLDLTQVWTNSSFPKQLTKETIPLDYMAMFKYRMAVFSGVRSLFKSNTQGIQTCAVISCLNNDDDSCGLRADKKDLNSPDSNSENGVDVTFFYTRFNSISISSDNFNNTGFITPNLLFSNVSNPVNATGFDSTVQFGGLPNTANLKYSEKDSTGGYLRTEMQYNNVEQKALITAAIYSRVDGYDGLPATTSKASVSVLTSGLLLLCAIITRLVIFN